MASVEQTGTPSDNYAEDLLVAENSRYLWLRSTLARTALLIAGMPTATGGLMVGAASLESRYAVMRPTVVESTATLPPIIEAGKDPEVVNMRAVKINQDFTARLLNHMQATGQQPPVERNPKNPDLGSMTVPQPATVAPELGSDRIGTYTYSVSGALDSQGAIDRSQLTGVNIIVTTQRLDGTDPRQVFGFQLSHQDKSWVLDVATLFPAQEAPQREGFATYADRSPLSRAELAIGTLDAMAFTADQVIDDLANNAPIHYPPLGMK